MAIAATLSIYRLRHPDSGVVFYVGATKNPERRKCTHRSVMRRDGWHTPVSRWVAFELGRPPVFEVIETTTDWMREYFWIRHYWALGQASLNKDDGLGPGALSRRLFYLSKHGDGADYQAEWGSPRPHLTFSPRSK